MEIESEIISSAVGCNTFHKHVSEYGHRAWMACGKLVDVVYWDLGNGWYEIIDVIPKDGRKSTVKYFYKRLRKIINESYDENGLRIG